MLCSSKLIRFGYTNAPDWHTKILHKSNQANVRLNQLCILMIMNLYRAEEGARRRNKEVQLEVGITANMLQGNSKDCQYCKSNREPKVWIILLDQQTQTVLTWTTQISVYTSFIDFITWLKYTKSTLITLITVWARHSLDLICSFHTVGEQ